MRSRGDDFKPIAAELMLTAKAACDYTKRPEVTAASSASTFESVRRLCAEASAFCTFGPAGSTGGPSTGDRQALAAPPRSLVLRSAVPPRAYRLLLPAADDSVRGSRYRRFVRLGRFGERLRRVPAFAVDAALAAVVAVAIGFAIGAEQEPDSKDPDALAYLLGVAIAVPLLVRRRW